VKKKNVFRDWLKSFPQHEIAKDLGVHRVQIYDWCEGKARPSLATAARILEFAGGKITLKDIVEGTCTPKTTIKLKRV
jgi:transcriptional regulator with XRE-family HTH domain